MYNVLLYIMIVFSKNFKKNNIIDGGGVDDIIVCGSDI